ncbi:MAG: permease prefix domain 1-containing protein [Candidatus Palauibacterales bacterium]|nr:permease prefix domain 1-containing protein [Candidatus Palauibacterales bacterium]MDP2528636.1 permease prefix domain 1-containing protein [Candidatus Palauibacterales bacterium]MDP2583324.1 permease prefix domain 1-containing protein [Candidatus Palauibacterales bacterium]
MEVFERVLRRAEAGLRVPEPRRSRILLEMASDLEDLYRSYRERGLDEEEARERAVRLLGASPEVLAELGRTHGSRMAGVLDRVAGAGAHRLESALVVLVAALAAAVGAYAVWRSPVAAEPSPWTWAVLALAGLGAGAGLAHGLALFVRPRRITAHPVASLRVLPGLAMACVTASALGGLVVLAGIADAAEHGRSGSAVLWHGIAQAAGLGTLGLTSALVLAGVWLLLRRRARAVERARAAVREALADGIGPPTGPARAGEPGTSTEGDIR